MYWYKIVDKDKNFSVSYDSEGDWKVSHTPYELGKEKLPDGVLTNISLTAILPPPIFGNKR